jgi:hypothetical protein
VQRWAIVRDDMISPISTLSLGSSKAVSDVFPNHINTPAQHIYVNRMKLELTQSSFHPLSLLPLVHQTLTLKLKSRGKKMN